MAVGLELNEALEERDCQSQLVADAAANLLAAHLLRLCGAAGSAQQRARYLGMSTSRLRAVLDFVDSKLDQPITLRDMAEQAGLSPYHFARAFRAAVGTPPHRFVIERRIETARQRLKNKSLSIQEVAFSVGFFDPSRFARQFRRSTGVSPREFRGR